MLSVFKNVLIFAAIIALAFGFLTFLFFFFPSLALLSGAASRVGSGHGSEDEHPAQ